eukprot:2083160-Prymnesium_polylepis.1
MSRKITFNGPAGTMRGRCCTRLELGSDGSSPPSLISSDGCRLQGSGGSIAPSRTSSESCRLREPMRRSLLLESRGRHELKHPHTSRQ